MDKGSTHWEDCWKDHHACALERIAELEKRASSLVAALRCAPMSWPQKQINALRELLEGK